MNDFKKELNSYYKDIADCIPAGGKHKKIFISDLKECIGEYISENPGCTAEDIENRFGAPEEIALGFAEGFPEAAARSINIKKLIIVAVVIALFIWFAFAAASLIDVHNEARGTFTEGILSITAAGEVLR